jgi:hypothetical protein
MVCFSVAKSASKEGSGSDGTILAPKFVYSLTLAAV